MLLAILPLRYIPDAILRAKTVRLRDLRDPAIQRLIDEMIESMVHYNGVGLAANQVGSRHRICIIQRPEEDPEPLVLVNAEVTRREGEREVTEGCLSLPTYQGTIIRSERVWAKARDRHGKPIQFKGATDLLAQALEHETDHLNGTVYTDHLRSPGDLWRLEPAEEVESEGSGAASAEESKPSTGPAG